MICTFLHFGSCSTLSFFKRSWWLIVFFFFVICLRLSFLASWSCFFYIILYVISPVYMLADRVFFCTMRIFAKEILIYDNVILHLYYRDKHTKLCSRNPVWNPLLPFLLLSQFVLLFLNPNNLVS